MTKVFVFLGNERKDLEKSRHNAGFIAAEEFRKHLNINEQFQRRFAQPNPNNYEFCETEIDGEKIVLLKPIATDPTDKEFREDNTNNPSYGNGDINHSGFGLKAFLEDYKKSKGTEISTKDIVVFADALSKEKYPKPRYITKSACEDETHNGLKSISNEVGGGFVTIDIPIGKQDSMPLRDYVSSNFSEKNSENKNNEVLSEHKSKLLHAKVMAQNISHLIRGNFGDFNNAIATDSKKIEQKLQSNITLLNNYLENEKKTLDELQTDPKKFVSSYRAKEKTTPLLDADIINQFITNSNTRIDSYTNTLNEFGEEILTNDGFNKILLEKEAKPIGKKKESKKNTIDLLAEREDVEGLKSHFLTQFKDKPGDLEAFVKNRIYEYKEKQRKEQYVELNRAIENSNESAIKSILSTISENYNQNQRVELLTRALIQTFTSDTKKAQFSNTNCIVNEILEQNLLGQVIENQRQNQDNSLSVIHCAVRKNISSEQLELLLENGFGEFVDKEIDKKTPLKQALEISNPNQALPIFWQIYKYSKNADNLRDCIDFAKTREDDFTLKKEQQFSDLEISRMLPHRLMKEQLKTLKDDKPKVFMPYYDYNWGRSPKQVLQDFGCDVLIPSYNIADDSLFASQESLELLRQEIAQQIKMANGLTVLGNNGNIDPAFFNEGQTINLQDFYQRRTFVEMIALQEALKQDLPIWTICGGTQMAITALGGQIEILDEPQNLKGVNDSIISKKGSLADLGIYSKNKNRGEKLLESNTSWSAHFQGAKVKKLEKGAVSIVPTDKFSVLEINDDEFSFSGLPREVKVVSVSEQNPYIPKVYELVIKDKKVGLMTQNHFEADPSTNPVSRNAIGNFAQSCRNNMNNKKQEKPSSNFSPQAEKIGSLLNQKIRPSYLK